MATTPHPPAAAGVTVGELVRDFHDLGISRGDVLFVHCSFKSLGPVQGGAGTVVAALQQAIGDTGTLLMPSFNLVGERAKTWNIETSPSTVGWITEYFRRQPGVVRSDHYSHSVAAWGKDAGWFVEGHRSQEGYRSMWDLAPWGRCYGTHSPMKRAYDRDGKCLFLGTEYRSATYTHMCEARVWTARLEQDPEAGFDGIYREAAGAFYDATDRVRIGKVARANCRLFSIRDYVDTIFDQVMTHPQRFTNPWDPRPLGLRRVFSATPHTVAPASDGARPRIDRMSDGGCRLTCQRGDKTLAMRCDSEAWTQWTPTSPSDQPDATPVGELPLGLQANSTVVTHDGRLLCLCESPGDNALWTAHSDDAGKTFHLRRLNHCIGRLPSVAVADDGQIVLVYVDEQGQARLKVAYWPAVGFDQVPAYHLVMPLTQIQHISIAPIRSNLVMLALRAKDESDQSVISAVQVLFR